MAKKVQISETKKSLLEELELRVSDKILEPSNAALLSKLIINAENDDEALAIAALGTTYKRTGFHWDKRLEKMSDTIKYFRRNDALSFGEAKDGEPVHKLIIGDNYDALQNLLIEYRGRVDVIYIDPPYGKDSMGEFAKTNYENAISRDNLLSMLYFRLQLAKQLLSENGVIYCSIDDKNQAYIKCLFDDVFRESNFVGMFMWYKSETPPNLSKKIKKHIEYILCYQRKKNNSKFKGYKTKSGSNDPVTKPQNSVKVWEFKANQLKTELEDQTIKAGMYGTKKYPNKLLNDLIIKDGTNVNNVSFENRFIWTQKKLDETLPTVDMFISKDLVLSYKRHVYETPTPSNLIDSSVEVTTTEKAGVELEAIFGYNPFDFPKPVDLIRYLLGFTDKEDLVVLDFFAGSGTTGHAVLDLNRDGGNRTFLLCQINEKDDKNPHGIAYDATAPRLKHVMTGERYDGRNDFKWAKENKPYGGNLEVYEIAEISSSCAIAGQTPFEVIDETLYGQKKFKSMREKIDWVCSNFAHTQMVEPKDE